MRVLFATYAERTHLQPLVPLAWALRNAGHDVCVASQPALVEPINQTGLPAVQVGRDHNLWRVARRFLTRRVAQSDPALYDRVRGVRQPPFDIADAPLDGITWEHVRAGYEGIVKAWYKLVNDPMVDDLVAFARAWLPDLVIWEAATYAGPVAAGAADAVHVRLLCNLDMFGVTRTRFLLLKARQPAGQRADPLAEWLAGHVARAGGTWHEDLTTGQFTIDQYPPSLRLASSLRYLPMRYVPYNGSAQVPSWLRSPARRPRVGLTLGRTSAEEFDGYAVHLPELIDALAELDIELVATWPGEDREALPSRPERVRVAEFVPLHALAPTCAVMIHHGAFGTVNTTMLAGVPQLVVPERHDSPLLARRVVEYGAGLAIPQRELTTDNLVANVRRLLTEPSFRTAATRLREEMLAMPTPSDVVSELETLVANHRGSRRRERSYAGDSVVG